MEQMTHQVAKYWSDYVRRIKTNGDTWGSKEFFAEIKSQHDQMYGYANRILDLASLQGRSLLELGCGIGLDTVSFAKHGARVTAIDLSPSCLDLAKRWLGYCELEATLEVGNAEDLHYPSNTFDIVVARGLLMFTPNERKVVAEILRVLKPGGVANILLHNRWSWYVLFAKASRTNLVDEAEDPPINKLHSVREAQRLCAPFSYHQVTLDRFPSVNTKRVGLAARLYNRILVPATQRLPHLVIRPVGYYIIIKAIK